MTEEQRREAKRLLESSAIHWERDWDALVVGFVVGVLATLVVGFGWRLWAQPFAALVR